MGKIAKGVDKIKFTMLYGNYCYIITENFPKKFSPCILKAPTKFGSIPESPSKVLVSTDGTDR